MDFPADESSCDAQGQGHDGFKASSFGGDVTGTIRAAVARKVEVDAGEAVVEGEPGEGPVGQDLFFNHFEGLIRNVFRWHFQISDIFVDFAV